MWGPRALSGLGASCAPACCRPQGVHELASPLPPRRRRRRSARPAAQYDREAAGRREPARGRPTREYWEETAPYDYAPSRGGRQPPPPEPPNRNGAGGGGGGGGLDNVTKSIIAGAFLMGIGTGVW